MDSELADLEQAAEALRAEGDLARLAENLRAQVLIHLEADRLTPAAELLAEKAEIHRETNDPAQLQECLRSTVVVLRVLERFGDAREPASERVEICRGHGWLPELREALDDAALLWSAGSDRRSLEYVEELLSLPEAAGEEQSPTRSELYERWVSSVDRQRWMESRFEVHYEGGDREFWRERIERLPEMIAEGVEIARRQGEDGMRAKLLARAGPVALARGAAGELIASQIEREELALQQDDRDAVAEARVLRAAALALLEEVTDANKAVEAAIRLAPGAALRAYYDCLDPRAELGMTKAEAREERWVHLFSAYLAADASAATRARLKERLGDGERVSVVSGCWFGQANYSRPYDAVVALTDRRLLWVDERGTGGELGHDEPATIRLLRDGRKVVLRVFGAEAAAQDLVRAPPRAHDDREPFLALAQEAERRRDGKGEAPASPGADPKAELGEIRVFVSSTFRDMEAERDLLLREVFPQLRAICEGRGVQWSAVDLRWGVTDEEEAEGQVLPICLREIERCRPYFIGLLGERYGWVPDRFPPEAEALAEWLPEYRGRSVTEIEIVHGVLRNPEMAGHAFFYFRDPGYVERTPDERRGEFIEQDGESTGASSSAPVAAEERRERLRDLKRRILESEFPVRENYRDPQELGRVVLEDFKRVIDERFPESRSLTVADVEHVRQRSFVRSKTRGYVQTGAGAEALERLLAGERQALVVSGADGLGKSSLLADWSLSCEEDSRVVVASHFAGATAESTRLDTALDQLCVELATVASLERKDRVQPAGLASLRDELGDLLAQATASGRVILMVDGVDELSLGSTSEILSWIPELPEAVGVVLSAQSAKLADAVRDRGWSFDHVELADLDPEVRLRLIREYLSVFAKGLPQSTAERIAGHRLAGHPMFLRVLLDELCVAAQHETLDQMLDRMLAAASIDDLIQLVFERWEGDYEHRREGLVGDALRLLAAARAGLEEEELLTLLGTGSGEVRTPLPMGSWAPLRHAAHTMLAERGGLVIPADAHVRAAIADRYAARADAQRRIHARIADLMHERGAEDLRALEELPYQLMEAGDWTRLAAVLRDETWLTALCRHDRVATRHAWERLEAQTSHRLDEAIPLDSARRPTDERIRAVVAVVDLLLDLGRADAVDRRLGPLAEAAAALGDPEVQEMVRMTELERQLVAGDAEAALTVVDEMRSEGDLGDEESLSLSAFFHAQRQDSVSYGQAMDEIAARQGEAGPLDRAQRLAAKAGVMGREGEYDGMLELGEAAIRDGNASGETPIVIVGLSARMSALLGLRRHQEAIETARELRRVADVAGDRLSAAYALALEGKAVMQAGDAEAGERLFEQAVASAPSASGRSFIEGFWGIDTTPGAADTGALGAALERSGLERDQWLELAQAALGAGDEPLLMVPFVGNFMAEDSLLIATAEELVWHGPNPRDDGRVAWADRPRIKVPRLRMVAAEIVVKLAGDEINFPIWGKRKQLARELEELAEKRIKAARG